MFTASNGIDRPGPVLPVTILLLLCLILFLGLRPKGDAGGNHALAMPDLGLVRFVPPSMAYVDNLSFPKDFSTSQSFTFHLAFTPGDLDLRGFRPLLTMHNGRDEEQLTVWHWGGSVIAMNGNDYDYKKRWPRVSSPEVLEAGKTTLLSIVSGSAGTFVYLDGELAGKREGWNLAVPQKRDTNRLLLGNSVYGTQGWQGDISGLLFMAEPTEPGEIKASYLYWKENGLLTTGDGGKELFHYDFSQSGKMIADFSGNENDLLVPEKVVILKRTFFQTSKQDVHSRSFQVDAFLNLVGFIPLGFCFALWLRQGMASRPIACCLVTTLLGFGLSFGIELVQGWMPGRASSLIDLIHNSAGTLLGCIFHSVLFKMKMLKPLS